MQTSFRRLLYLVLFPLRVFGYGKDLYDLWKLRDAALAAGGSLVSAAASAGYAATQRYPAFVVVMFAVGAFLIVFWAVAAVIAFIRKRQLRKASTGGPSDPTASEAEAQQSPPHPGRIGIRSRGSNMRGKNWRIRNQDISIDDEGSDYDVDDVEIR